MTGILVAASFSNIVDDSSCSEAWESATMRGLSAWEGVLVQKRGTVFNANSEQRTNLSKSFESDRRTTGRRD
jgi:hypothetical protein